jgi:hypothetical protein
MEKGYMSGLIKTNM